MAQYLEGLCDPFQDNSTDRATQARQLRGLQAGWRWRARNEVFFLAVATAFTLVNPRTIW